jgi:hypothetical protein
MMATTFIAGDQYITSARAGHNAVQPATVMEQQRFMLGNRIMEHRPVLSLIASCMLLAIGAALAFALIVAGGSVALASHQESEGKESGAAIPQVEPAGATFHGMITDSRCGARHLRKSRMSSAECARSCVRKGSTYVLIDGDHRYLLTGDEDQLEPIAGTRATITGTRQGDTISVSATNPRF